MKNRASMSQTVQECLFPQPEGLVTSLVQLVKYYIVVNSTLTRVSNFHGIVV